MIARRQAASAHLAKQKDSFNSINNNSSTDPTQQQQQPQQATVGARTYKQANAARLQAQAAAASIRNRSEGTTSEDAHHETEEQIAETDRPRKRVKENGDHRPLSHPHSIEAPAASVISYFPGYEQEGKIDAMMEGKGKPDEVVTENEDGDRDSGEQKENLREEMESETTAAAVVTPPVGSAEPEHSNSDSDSGEPSWL